MTDEQKATFEGWVILELMGHRRLAGHLKEQQIGGASFLRLDVEDMEGTPIATQFYSPSAVYCITPTTEEIARTMARWTFEEPVHRWELAQLVEGRAVRFDDADADNGAGR